MKASVDKGLLCERCVLPKGVGVHGIGKCPLEPLHSPLRFPQKVKGIRTDPETLLQEYGVERLSQSREGRSVLENARQKYRAELVQPHDPEFKKLYGKEIKERQEARMAAVERSRKEWGEGYGNRDTHLVHES